MHLHSPHFIIMKNKTQENLKRELQIAEIVNRARTKRRKPGEKTW